MRTAATLWRGSMVAKVGVRIPDVEFVTSESAADIVMNVTDSGAPQNAQGTAFNTRGTQAGRTVVTGARIELHRPGMAGVETLFRNGVWSQLQFENYASYVATHEMGHALGLQSHSPNIGDVMHEGGLTDQKSMTIPFPEWITQADANTLAHAYCR